MSERADIPLAQYIQTKAECGQIFEIIKQKIQEIKFHLERAGINLPEGSDIQIVLAGIESGQRDDSSTENVPLVEKTPQQEIFDAFVLLEKHLSPDVVLISLPLTAEESRKWSVRFRENARRWILDDMVNTHGLSFYPYEVSPSIIEITRGIGKGKMLNLETYHVAIENLQLEIRTYNALKRSGINSVGAVLTRTEDELRALRGFGRNSWIVLQQRLLEHGYLPESQEPQNQS